ncbi:hypothetical protein CYMTET_45470 [Cymbomonas tetramitiformis]|uniref:Uncharacterized protein n=1 Tax=Cymbomonas tetramitiformis TaxID=36881 RepID=A0AAE0EY07_9CHLO|nr:hypothetical protein CYMTET_45470 [Cymbomonas tetramitiformis]
MRLLDGLPGRCDSALNSSCAVLYCSHRGDLGSAGCGLAEPCDRCRQQRSSVRRPSPSILPAEILNPLLVHLAGRTELNHADSHKRLADCRRVDSTRDPAPRRLFYLLPATRAMPCAWLVENAVTSEAAWSRGAQREGRAEANTTGEAAPGGLAKARAEETVGAAFPAVKTAAAGHARGASGAKARTPTKTWLAQSPKAGGARGLPRGVHSPGQRARGSPLGPAGGAHFGSAGARSGSPPLPRSSSASKPALRRTTSLGTPSMGATSDGHPVTVAFSRSKAVHSASGAGAHTPTPAGSGDVEAAAAAVGRTLATRPLVVRLKAAAASLKDSGETSEDDAEVKDTGRNEEEGKEVKEGKEDGEGEEDDEGKEEVQGDRVDGTGPGNADPQPGVQDGGAVARWAAISQQVHRGAAEGGGLRTRGIYSPLCSPRVSSSSAASQDELEALRAEVLSLSQEKAKLTLSLRESNARSLESDKLVTDRLASHQLEARVLARQEAKLRQQQAAENLQLSEALEQCRIAQDRHAASEAAGAQLQQQRDALRKQLGQMRLSSAEAEEVALKRCWLAHYWGLAQRLGVMQVGCLIERADQWAARALPPSSLLDAAARAASSLSLKIQHSEEGEEEAEGALAHPATMADVVEVERGLRELCELRIEKAILVAVADRNRVLPYYPSGMHRGGAAPSERPPMSLSEEESEVVTFRRAWVAYLWAQACLHRVEEGLSHERAAYWGQALATPPTPMAAVEVENALTELRVLGVEYNTWEARRGGYMEGRVSI